MNKEYDKYQVNIFNEDGTRELYGEYESYSDAEMDMKEDTGTEDYEIVKKIEVKVK